MHIFATLFGIFILILAFFIAPITNASQVVDYQTLAQYSEHNTAVIIGNLLIWLSALTKSH